MHPAVLCHRKEAVCTCCKTAQLYKQWLWTEGKALVLCCARVVHLHPIRWQSVEIEALMSAAAVHNFLLQATQN